MSLALRLLTSEAASRTETWVTGGRSSGGIVFVCSRVAVRMGLIYNPTVMNSSAKTPLRTDELAGIAALFRTLADPLRLQILQSVCSGPRCVSALVAIVGTTQANVSKHLKRLVEGGVLIAKPQGRQTFYALANGLPLRLCELVHAEVRPALRGVH